MACLDRRECPVGVDGDMACSGSVAHTLLSGAVTDAIGVHPIFGVFVAPPMSELLLLLVSSWAATAAVQTASIQLFTTCSWATVALTMLRENKGDFDVIISDVHMPDMDGFRLLELVGLEMDLPVITTIST